MPRIMSNSYRYYFRFYTQLCFNLCKDW